MKILSQKQNNTKQNPPNQNRDRKTNTHWFHARKPKNNPWLRVLRERTLFTRVILCVCVFCFPSFQHWKKYDIYEKQTKEETDSVVLIENLKRASQ